MEALQAWNNSQASEQLNPIEERLAATISIESALTPETFSKCNPQTQSPLFGLPPELRTHIFNLALGQHEDEENPYDEESYYWRPGYYAPRYVNTGLLGSCRLAWLEGNHIPISSTTFTDWFFRGPMFRRRHGQLDISTHRNYLNRLYDVFNGMTHNNLANLTQIRIFTELRWIEVLPNNSLMFERIFGPPPMPYQLPRSLTISIRHTDWRDWDTKADLIFDQGWLQEALDHPCRSYLKEFRLELETVKCKSAQLDKIAESLSELRGASHMRGNVLQTFESCDTLTTKSWWQGTARINGQVWDLHAGEKTLDYYVVTLVWRPVEEEMRCVRAANNAIAHGAMQVENFVYYGESKAWLEGSWRKTKRGGRRDQIPKGQFNARQEAIRALLKARKEQHKKWKSEGSLLKLV